MRPHNQGICRTIRLILNKRNASCRIVRSTISTAGSTRRAGTCALHRSLRSPDCKGENDEDLALKSPLVRDVRRWRQFALSSHARDSVLLVPRVARLFGGMIKDSRLLDAPSHGVSP